MNQWSPFTWAALFAISAMLVNTFGIWLVYRFRRQAEKAKEKVMCFAAGVLIASPLIMAFPEAVEHSQWGGLAALGGFIFMFFSNRLIRRQTGQTELAFGITALQGIAIHSLVDGIIYSVTFTASVQTGFLAGIGLVAHELAEGIITYTILRHSGRSARRSIFFAFLVAALTTPVGTFLAWPLVSQLSRQGLGIALGFVAGVLIYLSASHLLPEATKDDHHHAWPAFLSGIALSLLLLVTHH